MALSLVTAATAPLISLVEAKRHVRVFHDDDDDYLEALAGAVSENIDGAEGWLGRSIRVATWKLTLSAFPTSEIRLPLPPLREVTEVAYVDENGASQTYDTFREFGVAARYGQGTLLPAHSDSWPKTQSDTPEAVSITFEAGFDEVPKPVKQGALLILGHLYENREEASSLKLEEMPFASTALLLPYRSWAFS